MLRCLKPNILAVALFIGAIYFLALIGSECMCSFPADGGRGASGCSWGFNTVAVAESAEGVSHLSISWLQLFFGVSCCAVVSVLAANLLIRFVPVKRPQFALLSVLAGAVLFCLLVSVLYSWICWGYLFSRPGLPRTVFRFQQILGVSGVASSSEKVFLAIPDFSVSHALGTRERDPYYNLEGRVLSVLDQRGLLDPAPPLVRDVSKLYRGILLSGILAKPQDGYDHSDELRGLAVEAEDAGGRRFFFLGVTSREVSNDHYAWYEVVLEERDGGALHPLEAQRFFYDIAGIEGLEWYVLFPGLLVMTAPVFIGVFVLAAAIFRFAHILTRG